MATVEVMYEPGSAYPFRGVYVIDGIGISDRGETLTEMLDDLEEKVEAYKEAKFVQGRTTMEVDW